MFKEIINDVEKQTVFGYFKEGEIKKGVITSMVDLGLLPLTLLEVKYVFNGALSDLVSAKILARYSNSDECEIFEALTTLREMSLLSTKILNFVSEKI